MIVLGLNLSHHGAAALVVDSRITAAVTEERLTGQKRCGGVVKSARACLAIAGLPAAAVDAVAIANTNLPLATEGPRATSLRGSLGLRQNARLLRVGHHLAHAASAFLASGQDRALAVVIDGSGSQWADGLELESYYEFSSAGSRLLDRHLCSRAFPYVGIGRMYEAFAEHLGWSWADGGRVMGLAGLGRAERAQCPPVFIEVDGHICANPALLPRHGMPLPLPHFRQPRETVRPEHADLAAAVQTATEAAVTRAVQARLRIYGLRHVAFAGGVALNVCLNRALLDLPETASLFIQPAADDSGTALGAALFASWLLERRRPEFQATAALGRQFDSDEIETILARQTVELHWIWTDDPVVAVVKLLARRQIIGWFQGRSEFGPRALGQRSILADPGDPLAAHRLNMEIKGREWFRPFAPAVTEESADAFFDLPVPSPYMLLNATVGNAWRARLPAVTHADGTARVQTVSQGQNPLFHRLLRRLADLGLPPIALNTSFNGPGQPIVDSPGQAIATFLARGLDALVIGPFVVMAN